MQKAIKKQDMEKLLADELVLIENQILKMSKGNERIFEIGCTLGRIQILCKTLDIEPKYSEVVNNFITNL